MPLIRAIRFAYHNIVRNVWLTLATVLILMLTLFTVALLGTINLVGNKAIEAVRDKVDVTVFFNPEVTETEILGVRDTFLAMDEVSGISYVSRDEALSDFTEEFDDSDSVQHALDVIGENPFGAYLVLRATSLDAFDSILVQLQSSEYADRISSQNFDDHRTLITRLETVTSRMQQIAVIVSSLFIFIAILVIFNTIRITIYSQREEIGIQRLVGATSTFIRAPYIVESVFYALLSSLMTVGLLFPIVRVVSPRVADFFSGYNLNLLAYYTDHFWAILALMIIIGVLLSVVSSTIAISRYLRV